MQKRSLRSNVVWAFLGNAVVGASSWLLLILLTKSAPVKVVGIFGVAQAIGLPASKMLSLRLQTVQVTDAAEQYRFGHYCALKIVLAALAVLVISVIAFASYEPVTALPIACMGLNYAVVEVREMFLAATQKSERMDRVALSRLFEGIGTLALFTTLFLLTRQLVWGIVGLATARCGVLFLLDLPSTRRLLQSRQPEAPSHEVVQPRWEPADLLRLARLAAPMGLVAGLSTLIYSIPRLTVDAFAGKEATGYYSAIASLLALGNLFFAGLGQAASPRLAVYFQTNRRAFVLLAAKLAGVAVLLGLVGTGVSALIGEWLLRVLFTEDYAQYSDFFVLIMVVATLNFLFTCMQTAFSATRRFGLQLPIYLVAVGVLLLTSLQFVPEHGIYGAAWALMICNSVGAIGCIAGIAAVLRFTEPQTGNRRAG